MIVENNMAFKCDILLGMNVTAQQGLIIDLSNKVLELPGHGKADIFFKSENTCIVENECIRKS